MHTENKLRIFFDSVITIASFCSDSSCPVPWFLGRFIIRLHSFTSVSEKNVLA